MAFQVHYARDTFRPNDDLIPGNSTAHLPVEFDLCPAEGSDLARIKSLLVATSGFSADSWTPALQEAVISAFDNGGQAFFNCIEAIRGMTIPAAMAKRVGIIPEIPTHVPPGSSTPVPNNEQPIPVLTGRHFAVICGFANMLPLTMQVTAEIAKLSNRTSVDPRLFAQPSGSGGQATTATTHTTAPDAQGKPEGKGTVAKRTRRRVSPQPGTSDPPPSSSND